MNFYLKAEPYRKKRREGLILKGFWWGVTTWMTRNNDPEEPEGNQEQKFIIGNEKGLENYRKSYIIKVLERKND